MAILKIPRLWTGLARTPAVKFVNATEFDGLDAFGSETRGSAESGPAISAKVAARPVAAARGQWSTAVRFIAVIALTAAVAIAGLLGYQRWAASRSRTGLLTIQSNPIALEVFMAGKSVGRTPLTLTLAAGPYEVEVGGPDRRRTLKGTVTAGVTSIEHLEIAAAAPPSAETGTLEVDTDPTKLAVLVDGVERGVSPLTIASLSAGNHEVSVRGEHGVWRKSIKVESGQSASLLLSAPASTAGPALPTGGWLTVTSPIAMQLREGGKVIGTTESDRLMLPPGDHDIEVVNESLGFRAVRKMRITAGKTSSTRIELPTGSLSLNAQPWAEVWIDGERVGETPIGNLQKTIGRHEVIFRNPELGERRESVLVTVQQPVRLGVDLRKK